MHTRQFIVLATTLAATPLLSGAQQVRVLGPQGGAYAFATSGADNRAVIGVTTSTGSSRDTLGVLVTSLVPGGPAEKAGMEEGNRIAAINGVSLKLAAVDVGDWAMADAMSRRLTRELGKVEPGAEVELKVYSGGQTRTVKLKTVHADSLYPSRFRFSSDGDDDRAVLGVSLGSTGSKRDTLGVLIVALNDEGPASKAGLEEGNRIAAVNGVNLRVAREDAGDEYMSSAMQRRLQREMEKLKAGDKVSLRVYVGGGRFRDVTLETAKASDLPGRRIQIFGGTMAPRAPVAPEMRRRLETELESVRGILRRAAPTARSIVRTQISM